MPRPAAAEVVEASAGQVGPSAESEDGLAAAGVAAAGSHPPPEEPRDRLLSKRRGAATQQQVLPCGPAPSQGGRRSELRRRLDAPGDSLLPAMRFNTESRLWGETHIACAKLFRSQIPEHGNHLTMYLQFKPFY